MKAAQVRTVIIQHPDMELVHVALGLLREGRALTALQSGLLAEASIRDLELVNPIPAPFFDGINYVVFLFVATG